MLDDRKVRVLRAIVEDYVLTAEPVGSRTIARKYNLGVSPATIRNEMADLEEMGYLEQPHTSAGRIPSDLGYRYYVDRLMPEQTLSAEVVESIHQALEQKTREIQDLIQYAVRVLSDATNYLALVLGPQLSAARFHRMSALPLDAGSALLILVTDVGFVETALINKPVDMTDDDLQGLFEYLSRRLRGLSLETCAHEATTILNSELSAYRSVMEEALSLLRATTEDEGEERVYASGTARLFEQPEFRDVDKAKAILGMVEHDQTLRDVINSLVNEETVLVSIGGETGVREIRDCSLVGTMFSIGGRAAGKLAVLGPKRMDYAKVTAVVRCVQSRLSSALRKGAG
ncbi:MAG: heat-inducible transcriptional repressor HrcA [Firmicutes bacterium]|jgi:heat-inducible transcriptional repressor|nr:heat-inducible transcriptional repressor HrcA [Bacillota bacterium]